MSTPHDSLDRPISYLRVSVTDRCNLRCVYCMPEEGVPLRDHESILRYEEIARIVRVAAEMGITKIRLTGGEPLARLGVVQLVRQMAEIPGIDDLSMTTNGTLLAQQAEALAAAGLNRVNISLDSLRADRFRAMTRRGDLQNALDGIQAAYDAGLVPVKINMVVLHGFNVDEVADMARRTVEDAWNVRYIEVMPLGAGAQWTGDGYVPAGEIQHIIEEAFGPLEPANLRGNGPANTWRIPGAEGTIGFITPVSEHFCHQCNRLRLTADGRLLPCLLSDLETDLRGPLRAGADDEALRELFRSAIQSKPGGHHLMQHQVPRAREMSRIGG